MKMMAMEVLGFIGGASILGYMYLKKHPEKMTQMKDQIKEMSRMIYNKLDTED